MPLTCPLVSVICTSVVSYWSWLWRQPTAASSSALQPFDALQVSQHAVRRAPGAQELVCLWKLSGMRVMPGGRAHRSSVLAPGQDIAV